MIENLKIKHLSYSSIQLWNECPRLWWLKYKYSISPAGISAFPFGTAIHESIQGALLTGGINTETVKQFRSRLESAIMRDNIQISNRERLELINTGEGILEDPTIQQLINTIRVTDPTHVEYRVEFQVPGVPLPILGYIDILDDLGQPFDIKTSKYDWVESRATEEIQPDFYLTALDALGDHRHAGHFTHLILIKTPDAPSAYLMESDRVNYKERVEDVVRSMWAGVESRAWESRIVRDACAHCRLTVQCYHNP